MVRQYSRHKSVTYYYTSLAHFVNRRTHRNLPISVRSSIILCAMSDKPKLTVAIFENLRVPMELGRKIRKIVDNNLLKIRRIRGCCGDYGNPGC